MTAKSTFPSLPALAIVLALALAGGGCTTYQVASPVGAAPAITTVPAGLSIGELMRMLQTGRPQADIAADLRVRGLRVAPAPADLDVLAAAGAGPELLAAVRGAPAGQAAQVSQGGVAVPVPVIRDTVTVWRDPWPWGPFGLGFGLGYWSGPRHHGWGPGWIGPPHHRPPGWYHAPPRPHFHFHYRR
jgi:hypothetical protein